MVSASSSRSSGAEGDTEGGDDPQELARHRQGDTGEGRQLRDWSRLQRPERYGMISGGVILLSVAVTSDGPFLGD